MAKPKSAKRKTPTTADDDAPVVLHRGELKKRLGENEEDKWNLKGQIIKREKLFEEAAETGKLQLKFRSLGLASRGRIVPREACAVPLRQPLEAEDLEAGRARVGQKCDWGYGATVFEDRDRGSAPAIPNDQQSS